MKALVCALTLVFFFGIHLSANAPPGRTINKGPKYVAGTLIVRFSRDLFYSPSFNIQRDLINKRVSVGSKEIDDFFIKIGAYDFRPPYIVTRELSPDNKYYSQILFHDEESRREYEIFFSKDLDLHNVYNDAKTLPGIEAAGLDPVVEPMNAIRKTTP